MLLSLTGCGLGEFFATLGCCASDHAFAYVPYETATAEELEEIFACAKNGNKVSVLEADKFKTALLSVLAAEYAERGWGMELHIGPIRNNNTLMFNKIGPDAGFDSIDDREIAGKLSRFLDSLAVKESFPEQCFSPSIPRIITFLELCSVASRAEE